MKSIRSTSGFTLMEVFIGLVFVLSFACVCGLIYAAVHFIGKVW